MINQFHVFGITLNSWIAIPAIFLSWILFFLFIKTMMFRVIRTFANKTETKLDDVLINALDFPLFLLIFTSGGAVVERMLPVTSAQDITHYFLIGFKATTVVAIVLFIERFADGLLSTYTNRIDFLKSSSGIIRGLIRMLVIGLGVLILLDSFGVSITPIIASLGIGSLAVALALQPTLENFFSGMQLIIDKPIQVGHFVKLESGEEGYIHRIGWRSTWVRLLANNIVVIPNKSIVNSRMTNYYYPDKELAVLVQVGVHYGSDLEKVEKVTCEVGKEIMEELEGGVTEFDPFIRYHTFDSSSINFTVILRAREFVDNYLIKHEFIKKLHKRYREEGITIPYPIRAINLDQEQAAAELNKWNKS